MHRYREAMYLIHPSSPQLYQPPLPATVSATALAPSWLSGVSARDPACSLPCLLASRLARRLVNHIVTVNRVELGPYA